MAEAKRTRKSSGPRQMKPSYLVYKGENIEILALSKDAFEILRLSQGDDTVKYVDVSQFVKKKPKLSVAA
jgi:hypothetical protein